ncbi:MAG: hypothetical protein H0U54_14645 [Acidobacteria bacterium]|nr:hypothetical protein [Acidobacteriota bacterium]
MPERQVVEDANAPFLADQFKATAAELHRTLVNADESTVPIVRRVIAPALSRGTLLVALLRLTE